ncbi:MAG: hypothetical protein ACYTJ0_17580 [Planctomycetota bacterium]
MPQTSGLTVRQHERQSIDLRVEFAVLDQHRQQVSFSNASSALDSFVIRGRAVDISPGGMGLVFEQFVPKMCEGNVRVFAATPVGKTPDGAPVFDVIFEHRVKIRRIYMASHEPAYAAGVSFVDAEPGLEELVEEVLLVGRRAADAAQSESAGGGERPDA